MNKDGWNLESTAMGCITARCVEGGFSFVYVHPAHFDSLGELFPLLDADMFIFKSDLKSGYFLMCSKKAHKSLLGFRWKGVCYVYRALVFGILRAV